MADSLFDQNDSNQQKTFDPNKDYYVELVGEGKKFKTPQDLARGKEEADHFIEILKRQQDELRSDYLKLKSDADARANLEDLITKFQTIPNQQKHEQPLVPDVKQPVIDPKDIEELIANKIRDSKVSDKQQDNFNLTMGKLKEKFGPNFQTILKEQIETLGLTTEDVDLLARKSPAALFKTLGLDDRSEETFQGAPRSSKRTDNFAPTGGQKKTWSYFQNMKKNDPKSYYDPKTNIEMHNAAIELGAAFEDGNFNAV